MDAYVDATDVARPLAVRPREAAQLVGLSRSQLYELMATGQIKARKQGVATLIEISELERYLASLPEWTVDGAGVAS